MAVRSGMLSSEARGRELFDPAVGTTHYHVPHLADKQ
jgi:hypothetical protein